MVRKLIITLSLLVFGYWVLPDKKPSEKVSKRQISSQSAKEFSSLEFRGKTPVESSQSKENSKSDQQERKVPEFKEEGSAEQEEIVESSDEGEIAPEGLAWFAELKNLPGAYDLVFEIESALRDNPKAINFEFLDGVEISDLDDEFLERMIPDPELRGKWNELMDLILESPFPDDME